MLKEEYKGFRGLNALYRRLVAKQFTAVADFHNVLRTRFLRLRFLIDGKAVAHINKIETLAQSGTAIKTVVK